MTSAKRMTAGGLLILESAWIFYIQLVALPYATCSLNLCPEPQFNPAYSQVLLVLAAILILDGLVGIWGSWFAYPAGASLSAILLVAMGYSAWVVSGYSYLGNEYYQVLIGAALAAIALLVNLIAWREKSILSEQANPMNLPVFG